MGDRSRVDSAPNERIDALRQRILSLQSELKSCQKELGLEVETAHPLGRPQQADTLAPKLNSDSKWPLQGSEYRRYGRQMIVPQIGLPGQLRLRSSRVLIVGLGGLGCPAAIYLAGAGVGTLGLVDGDMIEESNLHRQILHLNANVGMNKARSAANRCKELNPLVNFKVYDEDLTPKSGLNIIEQDRYDLLLDCTDRPETRYMISDIAVVAGVPLVTASALKTDGQLMVLNHPPAPQIATLNSIKALTNGNAPSCQDAMDTGYCYRCVFPTPPPASSVQPCSEAGIIGPVVGTMGTLMSTEAIRVLTSHDSASVEEPGKKTMLLYSALSSTPFRSVRLKGRRKDCVACGDTISRTISRDTLIAAGEQGQYAGFCGREGVEGETTSSDNPQVSAKELAAVLNTNDSFEKKRENRSRDGIVIDVRSKTEFGIASLPETINVPLASIERDPTILGTTLSNAGITNFHDGHEASVYMMCRYGNDSRVATRKANEFISTAIPTNKQAIKVVDVAGGLQAWRDQVDNSFPEY